MNRLQREYLGIRFSMTNEKEIACFLARGSFVMLVFVCVTEFVCLKNIFLAQADESV